MSKRTNKRLKTLASKKIMAPMPEALRRIPTKVRFLTKTKESTLLKEMEVHLLKLKVRVFHDLVTNEEAIKNIEIEDKFEMHFFNAGGELIEILQCPYEEPVAKEA